MFNVRGIVKQLTPPIIASNLIRLFRLVRGIGWTTFYGNYSQIELVPTKNSYSDLDLCLRIVESRKNAFDNHSLITPVADATGYQILPLLVSQNLDQELTIIDFGGGAFIGLESIMHLIPNIELNLIDYQVIEIQSMVEAVSEVMLPNLPDSLSGNIGNISISATLPAFISQNNIVHIGSTIQYLPNYKEVLTQLFELGAKKIAITQTPVTNAPKFAVQQRNYANKRLAAQVLNEEDFINFMSDNNYKVQFKIKHDLPHTYSNVKSNIDFVSFIFSIND